MKCCWNHNSCEKKATHNYKGFPICNDHYHNHLKALKAFHEAKPLEKSTKYNEAIDI